MEAPFLDASNSSSDEEVVPTKKPKSGNHEFTCEECGKKFARKYNFQRHLQSHSADTWRCGICNQYFENQSALDQHASIKHQKCICEICGEVYKDTSTLNRHVASKHDGGRFLCPFEGCARKFSRRTDYLDHVNIHTGDKPFSCNKCSSKFTSRVSHKHHENACSGTTSLSCVVCLCTFQRPDSLQDHIRAAHEGKVFRCVCGFMYKYRSGLNRHKRIAKH